MIGPVLRKELATLWASPVPYVTGAAFHVALGLLSVDTMQARQQANVEPIVPIVGFLLLVAVPVLTMRVLADERRTGTLDVLLAVPVRPVALVAGKWLAVMVTVVALVAPVTLHVVLLSWWGEPDTGPAVAGALGLLLLAGAAVAVGVAASALTSSQAVAALASSFVLLLGWFLRPSSASVALRTVTARLSLNERLRTFAAGGIDSGDVTFLLAVTVVGLLVAAATVAVLGGRRPRRLAGVGLVALAVVVTVSQWTVDDHRRLLDLTSSDVLTLSEQTRTVIDAVDDRVRITAFVRDDAPGRTEARSLLDRYEDANRRIEARVVDPDDAPGEVRRLGVDPVTGGVALESAGSVDVVPTAIEQDLTLGLARLVRGELPVVCLTSGHGELDPEGSLATGFSRAAGLLRDNGYELRGVDLLAGPVPDACGALLVVGPSSPFGRARERIETHLDDDGRLGVFLEPGFDTGLEGVLAGEGIEVLDGVVVEGDPDSVLSGDPTAPLVRRYSSANPIVRNLAPTFFVTAGGFEVPETEVPGRTVSRLADTSPGSLLVEDPTGDETVATPGPITVAAASETSANRDGRPVRRRVVAVADADVVSNAFVGEAANGRFLVQAVDWLTVDDDLVSVSSNLAAPRPLVLTDARRDYARLLTAVLVPAAFLVAGGLVWAVRRGR